jgi:hypothetical protein
MLRYVQAQLVQAAQSAACNAKHNMEQRLARWLLLCIPIARFCYFPDRLERLICSGLPGNKGAIFL